MALSETTKEAIYLKATIVELGFNELTDIICDNRGAISLAENPVMHTRTRHTPSLFVRGSKKKKALRLEHISIADMTADIFTKALPKIKHIKCMELLGLKC